MYSRFHQQIFYKPKNKGRDGGYSVLVNYQSLLSNIFPLAPLTQLFFSIKYRRIRLLREFY